MEEANTRLLVVEDDEKLSLMIRDWFVRRGFAADVAPDGITGLARAQSGGYDAVILDVMLPGMDGFTLLARLREEHNTVPVLFLTARSGLSDKLQGFSCGAQDYLTKPFAMQELEARARVLAGKGPDPEREQNTGMLTVGDLTLSTGQRELVCGKKKVALSGREYDLAEYFFRNAGQILSKDQITEAVWGEASGTEYNHEEVYISFLRRKFRFLGTGTKIVTVRGAGYVLKEGT